MTAQTMDALKINIHNTKADLERLDLQERRVYFETMQAQLPLADDIVCTAGSMEDVPVEWIHLANGQDCPMTIMYLHGGGYVMGSINTHRELCSRIARASGMKVLAVDYRLAPEHPFPAALDDAMTVYKNLLADGYHADQLAIMGDSAGGGLTLATLYKIRHLKLPQPACAALLSPWTDLKATGDSCEERRERDPLINPDRLAATGGLYAGSQSKGDPYISPLYGDFTKLPPLLIQVGGDEVLYSDATRVATLARKAGNNAELQEWPEGFHVFQAFPQLREAQEAVSGLGAFTRKHIRLTDD